MKIEIELEIDTDENKTPKLSKQQKEILEKITDPKLFNVQCLSTRLNNDEQLKKVPKFLCDRSKFWVG